MGVMSVQELNALNHQTPSFLENQESSHAQSAHSQSAHSQSSHSESSHADKPVPPNPVYILPLGRGSSAFDPFNRRLVPEMAVEIKDNPFFVPTGIGVLPPKFREMFTSSSLENSFQFDSRDACRNCEYN